jgi:rod shape-determining protein MreB
MELSMILRVPRHAQAFYQHDPLPLNRQAQDDCCGTFWDRGGKKAVREAAEQAGASEVFPIEEPMAAAIWAGLPVTDPVANMIVDKGGGTTEVAIISLAGVVWSESVRVGGNKMNEAIVQYIKKKYNLIIGGRTAETVKHEIGTAYPSDQVETIEVKGFHSVSSTPRTMAVDSEEIRKAIKEQLDAIDPLQTVALGSGKALESLDIFKEIALQ